MFKPLIVLLASALLAACSSLPLAAPTHSPSPLPPTNTPSPTITPTPTATPLPATPSSPQDLQYDPQQNALLGEEDIPLYHLGENAWLPNLPEDVRASLPEGWSFVWEDGTYLVVDGDSHPLFLYDFTTDEWGKTIGIPSEFIEKYGAEKLSIGNLNEEKYKDGDFYGRKVLFYTSLNGEKEVIRIWNEEKKEWGIETGVLIKDKEWFYLDSLDYDKDGTPDAENYFHLRLTGDKNLREIFQETNMEEVDSWINKAGSRLLNLYPNYVWSPSSSNTIGYPLAMVEVNMESKGLNGAWGEKRFPIILAESINWSQGSKSWVKKGLGWYVIWNTLSVMGVENEEINIETGIKMMTESFRFAEQDPTNLGGVKGGTAEIVSIMGGGINSGLGPLNSNVFYEGIEGMKVIEDARLKSLDEMPFAGRVFVTQSRHEQDIETWGKSAEYKNGALDGNVIAFALKGINDKEKRLWKVFSVVSSYQNGRFFTLNDKLNEFLMRELYDQGIAVPGDVNDDFWLPSTIVSLVPSFYGGR